MGGGQKMNPVVNGTEKSDVMHPNILILALKL